MYQIDVFEIIISLLAFAGVGTAIFSLWMRHVVCAHHLVRPPKTYYSVIFFFFQFFLNSLCIIIALRLISGFIDFFVPENYISIGFKNYSVVIAILTALGWNMRYFWMNPRQFNPKHDMEIIFSRLLWLASAVSVLLTMAILLTVIYESLRFFDKVPVLDFLFGLQWSPQTALRADQAGSSGAFGFIPVFTGTLMITFIAIIVAVPIGLMAAIYLSEYASPKTRGISKPFIEVLAGIPTVVYGYFAVIAVGPAIKNLGLSLDMNVATESALAAGLVMGVMIMPYVLSLSDDVINSVPNFLREGSLGLGATKSETICKVVIPAAMPGITGAVLLAISRAIGETMIVVMAAGLSAKLSFNPLDAVTTVTVQIVSLLVGDQEFDSPKTLAAFALGLTLFIITFLFNIKALLIVKSYHKRYTISSI